MANPRKITDLVGRQLSSVEFVHDYFQLRFDGPCLSVYNATIVRRSGVSIADGAPGFRDALVGLIGTEVTSTTELADAALTVSFGDGDSVEVSLKPEDYVWGPEAAVLTINGSTWVW